jgi:NitT/TauT family transport system substrate-binding protein
VLILFTGCATPVQQGPKVRIAVGGQPQLVYLPTTLAMQLGHYHDEGLDVELIDFQGGAKALESLLGGSADVVSGYFDHTIQMAAEGKRMKAFVTMLRYPGLALVSSGSVSSITGLRGKNVGVSAPGSSTHLMLNHLLRQAGLPAESVSAVGIGMTAGAVAAMENGRVDAAIMAEPAISQLTARKGPLKILADARTPDGVRAIYGTETYPAAVFYAMADWIQHNEEIAKRLTRAIRRTLEWIARHDASEIAAKMPHEFSAGDLAMYTHAIRSGKLMYSPEGRMPEDGAAAVAAVMAANYEKVRLAKVNASECYTNQFVDLK